MPKTGTTSLQKQYFVNWEAVNYFGSFGEPESWKQLRILNSMEEFEYRKRCDSQRSFFKSKTDPGKPTLVSKEEVLIGHQYPTISGYNDRDVVLRRLRSLFDQPRVIVVLRNQCTFLPSFFAQWQKHWYVTQHAFSRWLDAQLASANRGDGCVLNIPRYDVILDLLQDVFGRDNLNFLLYEDFQEQPDEFLADFSGIVGARLPESANQPIQENVPPSATGLWLQKICARSPAVAKLFPRNMKTVVRSIANRGSSKKFCPSEDDLSKIHDFYCQGNRALAESTGLDLKRKGYPV